MKVSKLLDHLILIIGVIFLFLPIWAIIASSTHDSMNIARNGMQFWFGDQGLQAYRDLFAGSSSMFLDDSSSSDTPVASGLLMLKNSMIMGLGFALGKVILSMTAAYAIVYFRFPLATVLFWVIFSSLLLPLEVRIVPSYDVVSRLHLINTYTGLILPLIASATATFYFRQYYLSVPEALFEAAQLDNAGPIRFFIDILLPLSKTMIAAIFIIMFVYGWNQYLWPVLMSNDIEHKTLLLGIKDMANVIQQGEIPNYSRIFALSIISIIPPLLVVILLQKWFIKGLIQSEK